MSRVCRLSAWTEIRGNSVKQSSGYPDNSAMIYAPVTRRLFGGSQGLSNVSPESRVPSPEKTDTHLITFGPALLSPAAVRRDYPTLVLSLES
ncbi:hypothetical protein BMS3Bbin04_02105 [bacterium BMS3Bbin04]|nr:hypothetical protein BMS3Bbin04_02105 [bacterium BMS3Bbin04]